MIKVGDRVRVIKSDYPTYNSIAIVIDTDIRLIKVRYVLYFERPSYPSGYFGRYSLEAIEYVDTLSPEELLTHSSINIRTLARGREVDGVVL